METFSIDASINNPCPRCGKPLRAAQHSWADWNFDWYCDGCGWDSLLAAQQMVEDARSAADEASQRFGRLVQGIADQRRADQPLERVTVQQQEDGRWCADRRHRSGTPVVGRGATWLEALGDLLIQDVSTYRTQAVVLDQSGQPVPHEFFGPYYDRGS